MNRPATSSASSTSAAPFRATAGRRTRTTSAVAGLLGAAVLGASLLGGCSTQSPLQSAVPYQPADGVAARSGPVEGRDLLVIASQKDGTGVVSGSLINTGTDAVTVSLLTRADAEAGTAAASGATVTLRSREQKRLEIPLAKIANAPGAMTDIVIQTSAGQTLVSVPVLPPAGPYATLTATATSTAG